MDSFRIVPRKPLKKLSVELGDIEPERSPMMVGEFFLYRAIESFAMRVLFRGFRSRMIVDKMKFFYARGEVFLELTSVICKDKGDGKRKDFSTIFEKLLRRFGSM